MHIAVIHNRYVYRGGEDSVVDTDVELLRAAGHTVETLFVDNRDAIGDSALRKLEVGLRVVANPMSRERVREFLARTGAEIGVVHNFFPVLTPAVYDAHVDVGIPVVQVLHNYRLLCANGCLLRSGSNCEECVERGPWHAVRYGCYRESKVQTAMWSRMVAAHRRRRTFQTKVDAFLTPSQFARTKLLSAGLPPERVHVRPNPVPDTNEPQFGGEGAVYVGRLSIEKGVEVLLDAWRECPEVPLTVVGTGPLEDALQARARDLPGMQFVGAQPREEVARVLQRSALLIAPSITYETFGMTVAEAMACGTPSLVSAGTALTELVLPGETGATFDRGSPHSLAAGVREFFADPERTVTWGRNARARYEAEFAVERSLGELERVLESLVAEPALV